MKFINDASISKKLIAAFAALVVIVAAVAGTTVYQIKVSQAKVDDTARIEALLADIAEARKLVSEQQAAVRGLLISGDRAHIKTYTDAMTAYRKLINDVMPKMTVAAAKDLLVKADTGLRRWQDQIVARQIGLMRKPNTVDEARVIEAIGTGARIIAGAFDDIDALTLLGAKLSEKNRMAVSNAFGLTQICLAVGTLAALVFALLAWLALSRGIALPINGMATFMEQLAGGDYDTQTANQDRKDEIGDMARSVEFFRNRLIENREMQEKNTAEQAERVDRANRLAELTARFDTTVSEVLGVVSSASTELQATASSMHAQ